MQCGSCSQAVPACCFAVCRLVGLVPWTATMPAAAAACKLHLASTPASSEGKSQSRHSHKPAISHAFRCPVLSKGDGRQGGQGHTAVPCWIQPGQGRIWPSHVSVCVERAASTLWGVSWRAVQGARGHQISIHTRLNCWFVCCLLVQMHENRRQGLHQEDQHQVHGSARCVDHVCQQTAHQPCKQTRLHTTSSSCGQLSAWTQ